MFKLYPHQKKSTKFVRKALKKQSHVLFNGATGMGKSVLLWDMVRRDLDNGLKVLVLAPRRRLVKQLTDTLSKYSPLSVLADKVIGSATSKLIISSIQTTNSKLTRKSTLYDNVDAVYIDEVHIGGMFPPKPKSMFDLLYKKYWDSAKWVGMTATPITAEGYRLDGWDICVGKYQTGDLIDMGYLAKFKYLAPTELDTSNFKVNKLTQEFDTKDIEDSVIQATSIKSLLQHTLTHFTVYSTKAMIFCISIEHAKQVKKAFVSKGLNTAVLIIHSKQTYGEQERTLSTFEQSKSAILINVAMLTTGFDDKTVDLIVLGRPIRSLRLAMQTWGRGLRKHGDKVCTILDLCSTHVNCGLPDDERDFNRVKPIKEAKPETIKAKESKRLCQLCGELSPRDEWGIKKRIKANFILLKLTCPSCGGLTEERTDLATIDNISEIVSSRQMKTRLKEDAKGIKPLKASKRYKVIAELLTEFTRYKRNATTFCIREIREDGSEDILDYLVVIYMNGSVDDKTTWKAIDKLWKSAKRNIKK